MLDAFVEDYIEKLYFNENMGANYYQQKLFTKKDYYDLLKPAIDILAKDDISLNDARTILYNNSHLEKNVITIIKELKLTPGLILSYGTDKYREIILSGKKEEVTVKNDIIINNERPMYTSDLFDIASITKIFMSISILKLISMGVINFSDNITKYLPEFINLKEVTIYDLLSFNVPLKTNKRLDKVNTIDEAETLLHHIDIDTDSHYKYYSDMGVIILKYLVEKVTSESYYDFIKENILDPQLMEDTCIVVPDENKDLIVNSNQSYSVDSVGQIIQDKIPLGLVNDPKARILGSNGSLAGHAGLFSTVSDINKLINGFMDYSIINKKFQDILTMNQTGKRYYLDGSYRHSQYFGMLCFLKNPHLNNTEVHHALSGKSFAYAGYTGMQLTIDPVNQVHTLLASNRTHNRLISSSYEGNVNLEGIIDSRNYAHTRTELLVFPSLALSLQYKLLEDYYSINKVMIKNKTKLRIIK